LIQYIYFIIYGFFVGVLAKAFYFDDDEGSIILTVALGTLGSICSSFIMKVFGFSFQRGFSLYGLIPAVIGTLILLYLYSFLKRKFFH